MSAKFKNVAINVVEMIRFYSKFGDFEKFFIPTINLSIFKLVRHINVYVL